MRLHLPSATFDLSEGISFVFLSGFWTSKVMAKLRNSCLFSAGYRRHENLESSCRLNSIGTKDERLLHFIGIDLRCYLIAFLRPRSCVLQFTKPDFGELHNQFSCDLESWPRLLVEVINPSARERFRNGEPTAGFTCRRLKVRKEVEGFETRVCRSENSHGLTVKADEINFVSPCSYASIH